MQAIANRGGGKRKIQLTCAFTVLLGGLSGCTELRISDSELQKITRAVETSLTLITCQAAPGPAPSDKTIDIEFVEQSPGVWCPVGPVETCPQVYQKKLVRWRSVHLNDEGVWEQLEDVRFKVYLTPFQGDALPAANGETGFKSLDPDVPPGVYKYSVWDWPTGQAKPVCEPLDPNFFVNR